MDERFDIDVGYRDPDDRRDDFPPDKPSPAEYEDREPCLLEGCERCEGDGSYSELAPCTTAGRDCACNGPRILIDPCPDCGGSGMES